MEEDSTKRFSNRVENYIKYRPHYPPKLLECLRKECALTETSVVADIGSGTGILTELFLKNGNPVFAVEPNAAMRAAAEASLSRYSNFTSIVGTAESTTLPQQSVNFVTVGQAFHWFDPAPTKIEFRRILKPEGFVVLVWNERWVDADAFMEAYEELLGEYGINYHQVKQTASYKHINDFFDGQVELRILHNVQTFDFEGLKGRLLSSSYAPLPDHPLHFPMIARLRALFDAFEQGGHISFIYKTLVYFSQLR